MKSQKPHVDDKASGDGSSIAGSHGGLDRVQDLLPAFIDALADAVLIVDRSRQVIAANRRYVETFGSRRVDVLGSACTESRHGAPVAAGQDCCPVCDVIEHRAPRHQLRPLPDDSGATRRYDATFSPIVGSDGIVTHVVEVWRDITDRSRLEVQLSHSERLASVGLLAAGVAHEINNPLASMMAGVEALSRWLKRAQFDSEGIAEARETLQVLEHEIDRARNTTEKLMLLGRSYDSHPGWVDLNQAVLDTLVLLRYELRKREIEPHEDLDPNLPQVWAREAGMRGVCMNLMINAVQALGNGGHLSVTTRKSGEYVKLTVEDTGPGIAPEHLERIWDPFFTTKPVGQGTGLGLSITNQIVTRHGGRVAVNSSPGHGARFEVEIPIHGTGGDV